MLKRYATILAAALALAASQGLRAQTPTPPVPPPVPATKPVQTGALTDLETWTSPDKAIKISYPKGWVVPTKETAGIAFSATNDPGADLYPESIQLFLMPGGGDAKGKIVFDSWAKAMRKAISEKVKDYKQISDVNGTIAGVPTLRMVYDGKPIDNQCRTIQYTFYKNPNTYALSFVFDPKRTKDIQPMAAVVAKSLTIVSAAEVAKTPTLWESKEHNFKLTYPAGWVEAPTKDPKAILGLATKTAPGKLPHIMSVRLSPLQPGEEISLREIEENFLDLIGDQLATPKIVKAADFKLGGEPARRIMLSGNRVSDNVDVRTIFACTRHGRDTIALVATAWVDELKALEADFDRTAASFAFTQPKSDNPEKPAK